MSQNELDANTNLFLSIDTNTRRVECSPRRLLRVRNHLSRDNLPCTHQGRQIHVTNFAHNDEEA